MYETIATAVVQILATFLPALAIAVLAAGAIRAALPLKRAALAIISVALIFGLWHAAVVAAAKAGLLMAPITFNDPPFILIPLIGGTAFLWGLGRLTTTGRIILNGVDPRLLIGIQAPRLVGAVFLLGWAMGEIPWQFALPAGLGDMLSGLVAIQAVRALDRGDANADAVVRRAIYIGLADFAVAVTLGVITSAGFGHLLAHQTPNIINAYPLALFPQFVVPIFIAFQLFSLDALRRADLRPAIA